MNTMVYRGDPNFTHIEDGKRVEMGRVMAGMMEASIKVDAWSRGEPSDKPPCPGCYMTASYNMMIALAKESGQSMDELADTMIEAFKQLKKGVTEREYVDVIRKPSFLDSLAIATGAVYGYPPEMMI